MEFWVKLIKVTNTKDVNARDDLYGNCTHVGGDFWLFEGDEDALNKGIKFEIVGEEAIESHGDLSGREIKKMVLDYYDITV